MRENSKESSRVTLGGLAELLERGGEAPFILGKQPSCTDILVGGWLRMSSKTVPAGECEEICGGYEWVFRRLHAARQQRFGDVK